MTNTRNTRNRKARPGEVYVLTSTRTVREPGSLVQVQFNTAGGGWVYVTFRAIGADTRGRAVRRAEANTIFRALRDRGFQVTEHYVPRRNRRRRRRANEIHVDGVRIA